VDDGWGEFMVDLVGVRCCGSYPFGIVRRGEDEATV